MIREGYVSTTVAAFRLGISREAVIRWILTRRLLGLNEDGRWLVDESSLATVAASRASNRGSTEIPLPSKHGAGERA